MPITAGSTATASEVRKQQAINLTNLAQLYYNSKYIGYHATLYAYSGAPNTYNLSYGTNGAMGITTTVGTTTTCINNSGLFTQNGIYMIGRVYDYLEGTTIDTNKFTATAGSGGSTSQSDNTKITASLSVFNSGANSCSVEAKGATTSLDLKGSGSTAECVVACNMTATAASGGGASVALTLIDESSNTVTLATTQGDKVYRLIFTANNCRVADVTSTWNSSGSDINTSTLSGTVWHLKATGSTTGNGGNRQQDALVELHPIFYAEGTSITSEDLVTSTTTTTDSVGTVYFTSNQTSTGVTNKVSGDSGSNYTTVTNNAFTTITNNGTGLKNKFTMGGAVTELPKLYEYATFYGVWV